MKIIVYVLSLMQGMYSFTTVTARLFRGRTDLQMLIQPPPTYFIEYSNVPSCVNCRFFIHTTDLCFAKCAKFGTKNMVSGVVNHNFASICRDSSNLCREDGRYYEEAPKNDLDKTHDQVGV